MNLQEFEEKFKAIGVKHEVDLNCDDCDKQRTLKKENAIRIIKKWGKFTCASCSMKSHHKQAPHSEESYKKVSEALTGIVRSEETKLKMSEAKKTFFTTPEGEALKLKLSLLAAQGHADNKFENAKRQGWYPSTKTGKPMFYGSSYELRLCWLLDHDDDVETYETQIAYQWQGRGRCLDFLVTFVDQSKMAIEVKPVSRLGEAEVKCQISDSGLHAKSQGWGFDVYTEYNFKMKYSELRDWADEFRKTITGIDYVALRKELNNQKAKKYYDAHIADNKIEIYCAYCRDTHQPLKLTYNRNLARNGRYICEREGGSISGSKPKKKKENPYAAEGKKLCIGPCGMVKLLAEFGEDKGRSDGKATRCKVCRAEAAKKKYQL
jgi:hypothetical protein